MKTWLCIVVLAVSLIVPAISFCQQERPETRTSHGTISEVDSVGLRLVIFDGTDQIAFTVEQGARITAGTESVMLDEIELSDPVAVEYYKADDGTLHAVAITDSNLDTGF